MNKMSRILHLLLIFSVVFLPMRGIMADVSVPSVQMDSHSHVAPYAGSMSHDSTMVHGILTVNQPQADNQSADCHDNNMVDCDACALSCTLKKVTEISGLSPMQNLYIDYSMPAVSLVLSSEIRPPIS